MTIAMERAAQVSRHHVAARTFGPINPDIAAALGDMGVRVDAEPSPEARIGLILVDGGSIKRSTCLLYTSPSPRDGLLSRMPSSA